MCMGTIQSVEGQKRTKCRERMNSLSLFLSWNIHFLLPSTSKLLVLKPLVSDWSHEQLSWLSWLSACRWQTVGLLDLGNCIRQLLQELSSYISYYIGSICSVSLENPN